MSAHFRPRSTVLFHRERGFCFSAARRARRRATFCWGVSFGGGVGDGLLLGAGGGGRRGGGGELVLEEEGKMVLAEQRIEEGLL